MKLSFQLFFVLSLMGTAMIAAEPCATKYGEYDMVACNFCAESGKGHGVCCDSIYRHSLGRNDDDIFGQDNPYESCVDLPGGRFPADCNVGQADCYPGLFCNAAKTCQLKENDPNAHAAASLVTSSSTGTTMTSVSSFVLIAVGATMIAMKVVRHRVLLHRHQYSEVEATATRIDV